MRMRPLVLALLLIGVVFAGCAAPADPRSVPGGPDVTLAKGDLYIRGIVVDEELVPVEGVRITDANSPRTSFSDSAGEFAIGPLESGEHVLTAELAGYNPVTLAVQVFDEPVLGVRFILTAIASTVPYHETTNHVTFVNCASRNPIGGMPCTALPDYLLGTNIISPDERFAFPFTIPAPNLANLLVEMTWTRQTAASDMLFKIQTPPNQFFTGLATSYFRMEGGQPLRGWVMANVDNDGDGPGAVFDAAPNNVTYEGMTLWSGRNETVPGVPGVASGTTIYINHRTEVWMTYFYNREGSPSFTALPAE